MFWGLNLKPNRKYSQTTSKNFHISGASLEDGDGSKVYVTSGDQKFLICTLKNENCKQVFLDLNFAEGEEVCFQTVGSGNVTLSGYIVHDYDDDDDGEEEEEEGDLSDSDILKELAKSVKSKKKAQNPAGDDDEEDEDDDEEDDDDVDDDSEQDVDDGDVEDDDEDEDDDDEEEESDDEVQQPKAKQPKLEKIQQAKQNGVVNKAETAKAATKQAKKEKKVAAKKENQKPQQQQQQQQKPQQQAAAGERTITGGVKIEDIRVGNGLDAKQGKRATVYYEGRLKSNNKVFDSLKQGSGFKFAIGRGEVIKGWDVGVAGMKVGGKRRITCPPHMAYGARGSPPAIPPNSTLVFEVELKGVN